MKKHTIFTGRVLSPLFIVVLFWTLGTSPALAFTTECTGGTITHSGGNTIHTFTSSGTFDCSGVGSGTVSALVVAGGGSGEDDINGAGGGAGGFLATTSLHVSATSYPITVGSGGAGGGNNDGGNSSLGSIMTAIGGGAVTNPGGSGGGGNSNGSAYNNGGAGTPGQGHDGGTPGGNANGAGGGGGANTAGQNGSPSGVAGNGGDGLSSSISGSTVYYAGGGGGGGSVTSGSGGVGGGGNGATGAAGQNATANTGGGGGGNGGGTSAGGSGGSGIVIISYTTPLNTITKVAKTSDQVVTNSTTPTNDNTLVLQNLQPSVGYIIDGELFAIASSSADLVIEFSAPAGAILTIGYQSGSSQGVIMASSTSSRIVIPVPNTSSPIHLAGTVFTAGTVGDVQLKWAQATASSGGTAIQAGSYLRGDLIP